MPFCLWLGFSCLLLYMYTHTILLSLSNIHTGTHMLTWTICWASPVTGPQYRSIIYLRPLTLWIRSRFSSIMASLAQHPASIKAHPDMSHTHTHTRQNNVISLTPRCDHTYRKNGAHTHTFKKILHWIESYFFTGFTFPSDFLPKRHLHHLEKSTPTLIRWLLAGKWSRL